MYEYKVGGKYPQDVTKKGEGTLFDFSDDGATLLLMYNRPVHTEIENIRKGELKLGLGIYRKNSIIMMLYKFGSEPWIDVPYNVNLSGDFSFGTINPGMGYSNKIILVNTQDNIINAIRLVGWPETFSKIFREYAEEQRNTTFNKHAYDSHLTELYQNYNTNDFVKWAYIITKIGGNNNG